MSRLISEILDAPEPHFSNRLRELEEKSGRQGHDVRLLSELAVIKKQILQELKLDASDTTLDELFYAVRHRGVEVNQKLEEYLGVDHKSSPEEMIAAVTKFIDAIHVNRSVWVLKHSVIKQFLQKNPPKRLLKTLSLRSVESVLKRNNACEIFILANQLERADWQKKAKQYLKKAKVSDFDTKMSSLAVLSGARANKLEQAGYRRSNLVIPGYATGTALVVTPRHRFRLDTLAITLSLLHVLYDLKVYSSYFKYKSAQKTFGSDVSSAVYDGLPRSTDGNHIGWRALQKHINKNPEVLGDIGQPHFQADDILLMDPVKLLFAYVPRLGDWSIGSYGFVYDNGQYLSLHLLDIIVNASNELDLPHSVSAYGRRELSEELIGRYMEHPSVLRVVFEMIDQ